VYSGAFVDSDYNNMQKDSKIYIAGHGGLVGSAIMRKLKDLGFENLVFRTRQELNLMDEKKTQEFFEKEKPEYVFLAAAKVGGILANKENPADFIFSNLKVQANVIDSAYKSGVKKLLFLGSSCIYPRECAQPIKEEYLLTGPLEKTNDAYAIAKIAGIIMCQSYNRQHNTNFISVMPTNLYGPNDNFDLKTSHVLPAMIRKFHDAKVENKPEVNLWGTGSPKREFLHVDDLADACVYLMQNYNDSEIVNIGTGEDLSIRELAEMIKNIVGYQGNINWDSSKPDGTPRKLLDVSKLNNLGWKYKISLDQGIRSTYDWYIKKNLNSGGKKNNSHMKKALITGILGQDGPYLAKHLIDNGYKVYGLIRRYTNPNFSNLDYLGITDQVEYISGDMTDESSLMNIIKNLRPDEVYNLAAQSFVGASWEQSKLTTETNALGVLYLLNSIKNYCPNAKFYQASTSEMFGNSNEEGLQRENTPFHPRSPYAISKLYAFWISVNFKESYGMFCVNGILFNHESPIRGKEFVTRKITDGVARIKLGVADKISLGNLDSKRDWGFAGDYVEAMHLMMQQSEPDNYLVSTGETHSIRDFLDEAFRCVGIYDWNRYIAIDPRFARPAEVMALHGKSSKAKEKLGWEPKVKFPELVKMMMDADLQRVQNEINNKNA